MGSVMIVVMQPVIQIKLQLLNCPVYLAPERHLVELLQDRLVKIVTDYRTETSL